MQSDAHGWSRRSLAVAGDVPFRDRVSGGSAGAAAPAGGLELWLARLDDVPAGRVTPAADEAGRAARIADPRSRARFLASRALLREVLARRLGCDATALRFAVSRHGKPVLERVEGAPDGIAPLHFNLSHAGGWLLIATREAGPVGVDLEFPRAGVDLERLAGRVFSPAERAAWRQAIDDRGADDPAAVAQRWFFRCWTRKEALLKCLGTGFAGGASTHEVGAAPSVMQVSTPGHAIASVGVMSLALPDLPPPDEVSIGQGATGAPAGPGHPVPPFDGHAAVAWSMEGGPQAGSDGVIPEPVILRHRWVPTA